jgi:ATP-dependent DNA ligase
MAKRTQSSRAGGANPPEMPGFVKPQLATLKSKAPVGSQWLHEIKFDGYRVQIHLNEGKRKVYAQRLALSQSTGNPADLILTIDDLGKSVASALKRSCQLELGFIVLRKWAQMHAMAYTRVSA